MRKKQVLAVDLGASSGRVMLGRLDGARLTIEELHRFSNDPVFLNGTMYWDFLRLFHEIKQGILKAKPCGAIDSISVDTWGVDFGLVDRAGNLLENPVHYRDRRTAGMLEEAFRCMEREQLYQITGNQLMEINTAFQLLSLSQNRPELLERADKLLLTPDLFHYYLSGAACSECSIASTTQLMDAKAKDWSAPVFEKLGLPKRLMQPIVPSGTVVGRLRPEICAELGVEPMEVIASAGHDTQCALAAVPTAEEDFIFISCGTWALFGTELSQPLINEASAARNITNECGYQGKTSFLKNIIGLWLLQESRRQWQREGKVYSFDQLDALAEQAQPFCSFIDPDAPAFVPAGDLPGRIREYCEKTGQRVPAAVGDVVRCISQSLAFTYRSTLEEIQDCTGKRYPVIHMVGGGTKDAMLCQMTANACARPVIAGPVEATVYGNVMLQLLAAGAVENLAAARSILMRSADVVRYEPRDTAQWDAAYQIYRAKTGR